MPRGETNGSSQGRRTDSWSRKLPVVPMRPTVPDTSAARGWAAAVESVPIHFMHRGSSK